MPIISNIPEKFFTGIETPRNTLGRDVVSAFQGGLERTRKKNQAADDRERLIQSVTQLMSQENRQFGESPPEDQRRSAESLVDAMQGGISPKSAPFLFPQPPEGGTGNGLGVNGLSIDDILNTVEQAPKDEGPGFLSQVGSAIGSGASSAAGGIGSLLSTIFGSGNDAIGADGQVNPNLVIEENPQNGGGGGLLPSGINPNGSQSQKFNDSSPLLQGLNDINDLLDPGQGQSDLITDQQAPVGTDQRAPVGGGDPQDPQSLDGKRFTGPDGSSIFLDLANGVFVNEQGQPVFDLDGNPIQ